MIGALAVAAVLGAEALVAYVLAELFAALYEPGERDAVNAVTFVVVALVAYGHLRLAGWYGLEGRRRLVWLAVVPFVTLYGAFRLEFAGDFAIWDFGWVFDFFDDSPRAASNAGPALMGVVLLLPVWLRSAFRAGDDPDLEALPRSLGIPFTVVTVFVVLGAASDRTGEVARGAVAFYVLGLLALAFSQLALSGASIGAVRAGEVTTTLFLGIIASVLAGLVIVTVVFGLLAPVLGPPLGSALTTLLAWVLTPPAWLLFKLFSAVFSGAGLSQVEFPERLLGSGQPEATTPEAGDSALEVVARFAARLLGLALVAVLVIGAIALVARYRKGTARARVATASGSAGNLAEDVTGWLRSLVPSFRRRPTARPGGGVYALYADVLERSGDRGHPRPPDDTPREFAPELVETFHASVTDEITLTFEAARYGGHEPDEATLEVLEGRWREVR